jgi:hypothetical protein
LLLCAQDILGNQPGVQRGPQVPLESVDHGLRLLPLTGTGDPECSVEDRVPGPRLSWTTTCLLSSRPICSDTVRSTRSHHQGQRRPVRPHLTTAAALLASRYLAPAGRSAFGDCYICSSALSAAPSNALGNRPGADGISKLGRPTGETLDADE